MARIMIAVMPFAGHVTPFLAVIRELTARGHAVRAYTGAAYAEAVRDAGAEAVLWQRAPDFDENKLEATFPQLRGRKGPRQMLTNLEQLFIRTGAAQCADLMAAWRAQPWHLLLADSLSTGAVLAAETSSAPWATLSVVPLALPSRDLPPAGLALRPGRGPLGRTRDAVLRGASRAATAPLHRAYNETRVAAGLQRTGVRIEHGWYSPELVCVLGIAELDYPRRDLPEHVHYVGAIRTQQSSRPVPPWWPELIATDRAIVHVTQGTLDVTPSDLIGPSLEALALESVLVVAATGRGPATLPFATPANARVGGILPYAELLPRTTVMITNGGWGGVLSALSHGVPLIVAGGDIDKPEIAARVAFSGAGVDLRTGTPSPARIHEAYLTVTGDARFAERARALGGILAGHDAAAEVAAHCEALLASTPAAG